jgi:hypothetical protein
MEVLRKYYNSLAQKPFVDRVMSKVFVSHSSEALFGDFLNCFCNLSTSYPLCL